MRYFTDTTPSGNRIIIWQIGDGTFSCVADDANPDYQHYLEWLAAGNTPEEWNPDGSV